MLKQKGIKDGLNRSNEQYYYGFQEGEPEMKNANSPYNHSIHYVVLSEIGDEIKRDIQKYPFRMDDSLDIKFNGRHLCDRKGEYNNGDQKIYMGKGYFQAFLRLLEVETIEDLKEKNENSHRLIIEDYIIPTLTSRVPKKKLKNPDVDSISNEEETLLKKPSRKNNGKRFEDKLKTLENTVWYYYRFDYKNEAKPQSIKRLIFKIGKMLEDGDLEISLIASSEIFSDYAGRISKSVSNDKILICRLSTTNVGAKLKVLMFHIEPRFKSQIYLGQYLEYDDDYQIMSGTIIIEKISDSGKVRPVPKDFYYGSQEMKEEIDVNIQYYFEDKYLNFTKSPTGISTPYDLQDWMKRKRSEREKENPAKIYDLYISVPFVELHSNLNGLKEIEAIICDMLEHPDIKSIGIDKNKIHHRTIKSNQNFDPGYLLKEDQKAIQKSKAFLFIFPQEKKILTSVFIQAGYAIHSGFPTFILYKDLNCLPHSLKVSEKLDHVKMRPIESIDDILKFPEWVKVNEYYTLYDHHP
ncbi:MAG: hypothetical protein R2824_15105 [Saprospiraceae bacterium]